MAERKEIGEPSETMILTPQIVIYCDRAEKRLHCKMQDITGLTTTAVHLKLNGEVLAKVHFEHIPRANEIITLENDGTRYRVESVGYNIHKNSGGDVTCESIDVILTTG